MKACKLSFFPLLYGRIAYRLFHMHSNAVLGKEYMHMQDIVHS